MVGWWAGGEREQASVASFEAFVLTSSKAASERGGSDFCLTRGSGSLLQVQSVQQGSQVHLPSTLTGLGVPLLYQGQTLALEDFLRLRIQTSVKFYN